MELQEIHKEVLSMCIDDYTGLWVIISIVNKGTYSNDPLPGQVREKTIDVIRELLQIGIIEAGYIDPESHQFQAFNFSVEDTIDFIEQKWDDLGRLPNIGDICEFFVTETGKKVAADLGFDV